MAKALVHVDSIQTAIPPNFTFQVNISVEGGQEVFGINPLIPFSLTAKQINRVIEDEVIAACQNPALCSPTVVLSAHDIIILGSAE